MDSELEMTDMVSLQVEYPITPKKNGKTQQFQSVGVVRATCDHTEGTTVAKAIQAFIIEFTGGLSDNFMDDFVLIGSQEGRDSKPSTPNKPTGGHSSGNPNKGSQDRKTYAMLNEGYTICPMCWDGGFGVNPGTHKRVNAKEMAKCMQYHLYFMLCYDHQQTYWSSVKGQGTMNKVDFMNKLNSIKTEVEGDITGRYTIKEGKDVTEE